MSYFFFLYQSPLFLCTVFHAISSNIGEILWINSFAKLFVFEHFNVHHKDWLAYTDGTHRPGKLCYNFSTWIHDCYSHNPVLLDLFISINGFPSIGKFWSCCCLSSIDFPSNSKHDAPFHGTAYDSKFHLPTRDSYFMILVEIFKNHISAENTYFMNHRVKRMQDHGIKTCK